MKAVFIEQHGDASTLHYGDFAKPQPAAGQALRQHHAEER